jgi:hypothetical protein
MIIMYALLAAVHHPLAVGADRSACCPDPPASSSLRGAVHLCRSWRTGSTVGGLLDRDCFSRVRESSRRAPWLSSWNSEVGRRHSFTAPSSRMRSRAPLGPCDRNWCDAITPRKPLRLDCRSDRTPAAGHLVSGRPKGSPLTGPRPLLGPPLTNSVGLTVASRQTQLARAQPRRATTAGQVILAVVVPCLLYISLQLVGLVAPHHGCRERA